MNMKKIIPIVIIICIILITAVALYSNNQNNTNNTTSNVTNNTTSNITKNKTNESTQDSSNVESSKSVDEPEPNSKSYVEKWDESQKSGSSWAYTHDQPVKTGKDGKQYARVYDEDSGKSKWRSMSR